MANKYRGEIAASLDGTTYTLCLTLGALAELESAFGSDDMLSLAGRFADGRISARDCTRIIGAGLRGGGHDVADAAVARMRGDDGAAGFVDIVARLLAATFGGPVAAVAGLPGPALMPADQVSMAKAETSATPYEPFAVSAIASQPVPSPFHGPR